MTRVLLIGIDSLAPELLERYAADLPNFTRLRQLSPPVKLTSVFPVDSIPAWVSIFTGRNPARHGIVKTFDIFDSDLKDILKIDPGVFRGQTFWDYAGRAGKKVCVLFPLLGFPPWKVNGLMVSRGMAETRVPGAPEWVVERQIQAYPPALAEKYTLPVRGVHGGHPGMRNLAAFTADCEKNVQVEAGLAFKIAQDNPWDLFFLFLDSLDIVQHRLWRFGDEKDPTYPGPNPFQDSIRNFYRRLDGVVGRFTAAFPDAVTVVISDHGHGIRPVKTVNLNEVLRQNGLLICKGGKYNVLPRVMESTKNGLLDVTHRLGLDSYLVKLVTRTRGISALSKSIYMSTAYLDRRKTVAYLSSFAGVKSYPHGGVEITRRNLAGADYEKVRDKIIRAFGALQEPGSGEKMLAWVCRREELYPGAKTAQAYPDVIFELKEGYGTGWGIHTPLIGKAQDHVLAPGGHKKNAVFLLKDPAGQAVRAEMTLMDLAPTVLDLMGVKGDWQFDGTSIIRK